MSQLTSQDIRFKVVANESDEIAYPQSEAGLRVSEADYWENYYDRSDFHYEWNNGILEEKPVSDRQTFLVYDWFYILLSHFLMSYPLGDKVGLETAFRLALPTGVVIRKPDLGVVLKDNPVPYEKEDRSYHGTCDLCIEALSDSTRKEAERDLITKKREYQLAGVKEYYILDGKGQQTVFYSLNQAGNYQTIQPDEDGVIRSQVLPGFQFRVAHLYKKPRFESLVDDDVYKGFVLPALQAERARAEQAEAYREIERIRAEQAEAEREQERARAEQEKVRADRLAAKLRALGFLEE